MDQTKYLSITLDPTRDSAKKNGQPPPAVLISRILQSIERRCPNVDITIDFAHCQCNATPVSNFGSESFPRVKKLKLYVGQYDPEETHPRSKDHFYPSMRFWKPFFDGMTFPNCTSIEIRHHWAVSPPQKSSLDLSEFCGRVYGGPRYDSASNARFLARSPITSISSASALSMASLDGLEKVESIFLEYVPELDASILTELLGNPKSVAANLTSLDLRFCNLSDNVVAQLLHHAPPNLKRLVLLCRRSHDDSTFDMDGNPITEIPIHLCPLLRRFGKHLTHLEFGASHLCRQLFFDEAEIDSIRRDGIMTCLGSDGGSIGGTEHLDTHAIRHAVHECRRKKRTVERQQHIDAALAKSVAECRKLGLSNSLLGGSVPTTQNDSKFRRDVNQQLDEAEERRRRLIEGSKKPWFRRFIAWEGLCCHGDTWQELQIAADMEEAGILWVLASK